MTATSLLNDIGLKAKQAFRQISTASTEQKNRVLTVLTERLITEKEKILQANRQDIEEATASGMDPSMLDRLSLQGRLEGIVDDTKNLIDLPDPVGKTLESRTLPNGLSLTKRRTPIGVIGIIYESRPNVTIDIAALTIKTGNCAILRGGSETLKTNKALVSVIQHALEQAGLPSSVIQFIDSPDRSLVTHLLQLHDFVDMIIPRGGAGLHQYCREHSRIPVITGGIGICHLFIDESADLEKTLEVIYNAKTQRPTVCNALDTLLVHEKNAETVIPKVIEKLGNSGVTFKLGPKAWQLTKNHKNLCHPANPEDWDTEWLSLVMGIRIVDGIEQAVEHIQKHSSGHSDGILTEDKDNVKRFMDEVDSSCVYHNASTRFTDGSQFGLGAEVAISTQKLHARGPMGLEELTTYKWIVKGDYHVRDCDKIN